MQSHPQYVNSSVNRYHLIFDFQEHMLHAESRHLGVSFHALGINWHVATPGALCREAAPYLSL